MKFKAAILNKSKSDLIVDDIILNNSLETGQILVKLNYSGLCRSQINEIIVQNFHAIQRTAGNGVS